MWPEKLVLRAIGNGKHVVTANKALIALHGNEVFEQAQRQGVMVAFEAAVAGGIPIIKASREGLAGNRIEWVAGIINGTGNFILTEMRDKGRALPMCWPKHSAWICGGGPQLRHRRHRRRAQARHSGGHRVWQTAAVRQGLTRGIARVTPEDVAYAEELGYRIKHIGIARASQGAWSCGCIRR